MLIPEESTCPGPKLGVNFMIIDKEFAILEKKSKSGKYFIRTLYIFGNDVRTMREILLMNK